jgi:hypothetical protein
VLAKVCRQAGWASQFLGRRLTIIGAGATKLDPAPRADAIARQSPVSSPCASSRSGRSPRRLARSPPVPSSCKSACRGACDLLAVRVSVLTRLRRAWVRALPQSLCVLVADSGGRALSRSTFKSSAPRRSAPSGRPSPTSSATPPRRVPLRSRPVRLRPPVSPTVRPLTPTRSRW